MLLIISFIIDCPLHAMRFQFSEDIWGTYDRFPDVFRMGTFFDSTQMKLLGLHCTCCTVPTTSGRPHGSPLVWACQLLLSQPLLSPQLSQNDSLWALGITKSHREQGLDYWSKSLWQGWSCGLVYCPTDLKSAGLFRRNLFLNSLKTST